ncbi:MAG TPA: hypothetical protein VFC95_01415, partial [Guyparkeria sp.]|nr:hypothetical protein [Guyparkeria sp.]
VSQSPNQIDQRLAELGFERDGDWQSLGQLRHAFSHFELVAEVLGVTVIADVVADRPDEWHVIEQLISAPAVGLPAPVQRLIREHGVTAFSGLPG